MFLRVAVTCALFVQVLSWGTGGGGGWFPTVDPADGGGGSDGMATPPIWGPGGGGSGGGGGMSSPSWGGGGDGGDGSGGMVTPPIWGPGGGEGGMSSPSWGGGGGGGGGNGDGGDGSGGMATPPIWGPGGGGSGGGGGMSSPSWGGGGAGGGIGWGTTVAPTADPTCEGNGGQCVSNDGTSCDGEVGEFSCSGENDVCCLPNVLPTSCGKTFLLKLLKKRGIRGIARIVGGSESTAHTWPWQVSLQLENNFHFCGGTLISDQWVVTAAHCLVGESSVARVVMGEHDRTTDSGREFATSATVFSHPEYNNDAPYPNDIALLKLDSPVTFSEHMYPACLPSPGTTFDTATDTCWISGWGDTKDTGDENMLNELQISITDNVSCASKWGESYIRDTNICVGNGLIGACNGDSGGPLSCQRQGEESWELAGATSWGASGCRAEGLPNVYTRVSEYRDWIVGTIRKNL